ncbi:hypothetical protein FHR55_001039 [Xanthomonas arboricola]
MTAAIACSIHPATTDNSRGGDALEWGSGRGGCTATCCRALPTHRRGTRCKYVAVAPWRHPCRHGSREGEAPRARPGLKIAKRSRDARCSRRCLIAQYWWIRQRADHLRLCCRVLARPPSQDTPQVHPCSSLAASMPPRVPRRWAGKDQWRWSVRMALNQSLGKLATRCLFSSTKPPANCLAWCPRRLRDRVAAWMPPPSLQGRTCGVSRER